MAVPPLILEIQTGKHKGRRVRLTDAKVVIGRGEEARIRISSAEVSREHCMLTPQEAGILVEDLKSRNGTFVDGRPVNGQKLLAPGGTLTVGPLTFQLLGTVENAASRTPAVALTGKVASADKLSDAEIADWLSDDEIPTVNSGSPTETAILKDSPVPGSSSPVSSPEALTASAPLMPTVRKREFKSIGEEAQDIIRRHFETVAQEDGAT